MPVEINSVEDLDDIRLDLQSDYDLIKNLDFNDDDSYDNAANKNDYITGSGWVPISGSTDMIFDGRGHTITGLFINKTNSESGAGLFGDKTGTGKLYIYNLGLVSVNISNDINYTGADFVGNSAAFISSTLGNVENIVRIINCYVRGGNISTTGFSEWRHMVSAGIVGHQLQNSQLIEKSYAAVELSVSNTSENTNDLKRGLTYGSFNHQDCFWDEDISTTAQSSSGTGKTTTEMKDIDTYTDTATVGLDEAWDFTNIWAIDSEINDGYPYFIPPPEWATVKVKLGGVFVEKPLKTLGVS